jgi:hypothetical protein
MSGEEDGGSQDQDNSNQKPVSEIVEGLEGEPEDSGESESRDSDYQGTSTPEPGAGNQATTDGGGSGASDSVRERVTGPFRKAKNVVSGIVSNGSDVSSWGELTEITEDADVQTDRFAETVAEYEAHIQEEVANLEDEIAEGVAEDTAQMFKDAKKMAEQDLPFTYEFEPNKGEESLEVGASDIDTATFGNEPEVDVTTEYEFDVSGGRAEFLDKITQQGDEALRLTESYEDDIEDIGDDIDALEQELDEQRSRNDEELENSRSRFRTEEEKDKADRVKDYEDKVNVEDVESELSEKRADLQRKQPRKRQHLEIGTALLEEAQEVYDSHSRTVEHAVTEAAEYVDDMTDVLENLAEAQIGEDDRGIDEMVREKLDDRGLEDIEVNGRYLESGEGDIREFRSEVISQVATQAARQYAQGSKAIQELEYLEDTIEDNTDRLDLGNSEGLQEELDEVYGGEEDFETYLENQLEQATDQDHAQAAREEIRSVFRGLEGLADEAMYESN